MNYGHACVVFIQRGTTHTKKLFTCVDAADVAAHGKAALTYEHTYMVKMYANEEIITIINADSHA